jgi:hypothetical protein
VLARGRSGGVEAARLHEQHERPVVVPAVDRGLLRGGDLLEGPAEVHRAGAADLGCTPWDRPVERPVELEDPRPVAVATEPAGVSRRQPIAGELHQLPRGHVEQRRAIAVELLERFDPPPGLDPAPERSEVVGQGVRQALGAATGDRPADPVGAEHEHHPERRPGRGAKRQHRVRAAPGQQCAGPLPLEARAREPRCRAQRLGTESREHQWVAGWAERAQDLPGEVLRMGDERVEEPTVGARVRAEPATRFPDGRLQHHGRAVIQRVRERRLGLDELEAVSLQREAAQERRDQREGVHR